MEHSTWIRTDLHIHSKKSNEVKKGDYKGPEYSAEELIKTLTSEENSVGLFSITDHNIVNVSLYKEIDYLVNTEKYKGKINYVIGVEFDIFDEKIYKEVFHVLCLFKSKDVDTIATMVNSFNIQKETDYLSGLQTLFNEIHNLKLGKFILIPHFHNKSKGLPTSLDQIDQLTRLVFDAYEDSNNVTNIKESLSKYLKNGYADFPFVAFSDCHNLRFYPRSAEEADNIFLCSFLGNINNPFDTVKTVFEEPRLRISIPTIELMRTASIENSLISKCYYNDNSLEICNWLNTIIGPFGSGKSLLIDKIINGVAGVNLKYNDVVDKLTDKFMIEIMGSKYSSIREALSIKAIDQLIEIEQHEKINYCNVLENRYLVKLSKRLGFNLPKLKDSELDFKIDELLTTKEKFDTIYSKKSNAYSFDYEKGFSESNGYHIITDVSSLDFEKIVSEIEKYLINIDKLETLNLSGVKLFSHDDLETLKESNKILNIKLSEVKLIKLHLSAFQEKLQKSISQFNIDNDISSDKEHVSLVSNTFKNFCKSVKDLISIINTIEKILTCEIYNEFIEMKEQETIDTYIITCKYNLDDLQYVELKKHMYSHLTDDDTLVSSILRSYNKGLKLKGNKEFNSSNIKALLSSYQAKYKGGIDSSNVKYDILLTEKSNTSLLALSAGGRAKELLKLAFAQIEKNIKAGLKTIVIIDQPENDMDNGNIKKLIVEKIKDIKLTDSKSSSQFIVVTHNANVCITSDSENIIIAKYEENEFSYLNGCIENVHFVKDVCEILEGGSDALKARAVKYNINIWKGMEITNEGTKG